MLKCVFFTQCLIIFFLDGGGFGENPTQCLQVDLGFAWSKSRHCMLSSEQLLRMYCSGIQILSCFPLTYKDPFWSSFSARPLFLMEYEVLEATLLVPCSPTDWGFFVFKCRACIKHQLFPSAYTNTALWSYVYNEQITQGKESEALGQQSTPAFWNLRCAIRKSWPDFFAACWPSWDLQLYSTSAKWGNVYLTSTEIKQITVGMFSN